ncbi:17031_t:CDS:2, partial [Funneliformis geosporum]
TKVEEILDKNHSSLIPKVLDSSLNIGDLDNLFNKITGRTKQKRKNRSKFNQEEKSQKAYRYEVQKVKNLLDDLMYQRMEEQEYKKEECKRKEIERRQREEQRQKEFNLLISALHSSNNITTD